jgi:hypothetical protein
MRKPILILLAGAVAAWTVAMVVHARADDAPAPKWKIEIKITDKTGQHDPHVIGWYANEGEKTVKLFDTEDACKIFLKKDKLLAERAKKGEDIAHQTISPNAHLVWDCVADIKKDEI